MSELYTRYIKIAKIDRNGNDNSNSLSNLTNITIPWSDGSEVRYNVIGTSQQQDYFSYVVEYEPTSSIYYPDASTLDYNFSGSYSTSPILLQGNNINDFTYLPISQSFPTGSYIFPVNGPAPLYNGQIDKAQLKWDTYPQKDIFIQFSGSATANASNSVFLVCLLIDSTLNNITPTVNSSASPTALVVLIGAGNTESFNVEWSIPSGSFDPGSSLRIVASTPSITTLTFDSSTFLYVSSSAGNSTELEAVIEPFLDYKFTNSDCDVLQNNVLISRPNPFIQNVDYNSSQTVPTNYSALKNYTATKGTYPESNFTITSILNPSYSSENQINSYNVGSSLNSQTSVGTDVIYYDDLVVSSIPGFPPRFSNKFRLNYIYNINQELNEIIANNENITALQQNIFSSITSSLPIAFASSIETGSLGTGSGQFEIFRDQTKIYSRGGNVFLETTSSVNMSGTIPKKGIIYTNGLQDTSARDNPTTIREALAQNNLL